MDNGNETNEFSFVEIKIMQKLRLSFQMKFRTQDHANKLEALEFFSRSLQSFQNPSAFPLLSSITFK